MTKSRPRDDFASSALLAFTQRVLSEEHPELLEETALPPDPFAKGKVAPSQKVTLLTHVYNRGGMRPLLEVGMKIREVASWPTIAILLASSSPSVLAQKWMRLEGYYHSSHRVRIDPLLQDRWTCFRSWKTGDRPTDAENILIFGVLAGLLTAIGAPSLKGEIGGQILSKVLQARRPIFAKEQTEEWELSWKPFRVDQSVSSSVGEMRKTHNKNAVSALEDLLRRDIGFVWKVDAAASELGMSVRTLQRVIQQGHHTFTSIIRDVRVHEACHLLAEPNVRLAEVGYSCGYSDQSHFQNDFKRSMNMTPKEFQGVAES